MPVPDSGRHSRATGARDIASASTWQNAPDRRTCAGELAVNQPSPIHPDLELDDNPDFARRQYRVQQVGWVLLVLFLVAALAGVFGEGSLARVDRHGADGVVEIALQRFVRSQGNDTLTITVAGGQASNGEVRVAIDTDWLDAVEISAISPEPVQFEAQGRQQILVFAVDDSNPPLVVAMNYTPDYIGRKPITVAVGEHDPVHMWQVAYP